MNTNFTAEEIKAAMDEAEKLGIDAKGALADMQALTKKFANVPTMAEAKGLTMKHLEALYSVGYNFYKTGRFEEAEKIFKGLVALYPYEAKYAFALGSSLQAQKKYEPASRAYQLAILLKADDPRSYTHAAECLVAMGKKDVGEEMLKLKGEMCKGK